MGLSRRIPDPYQMAGYVADAALTANMVVVISNADGHVTAPAANQSSGIVGVTNNAIASGANGDVVYGGIVSCIANGAITRGHEVYVASALGDVADLANGPLGIPQIVGTAEESVSTTGDLVAVKLKGFARSGALSVIREVRCVADANVALTTALVAGQTIDGVTLVAGDRVLCANQTTAAASGVYIATAAGTASLAPDYATGSVKAGQVYEVSEGTKWSGSSWKILGVQIGAGGYITVGTTDPAFWPRMDFATIAVGTPNTALFIRAVHQPCSLNDTTAANAVKCVQAAGRKTGTATLTGTGTDSVDYGTFNW